MPTTRECVHLVTRDITSGHVPKMAIIPFNTPY